MSLSPSECVSVVVRVRPPTSPSSSAPPPPALHPPSAPALSFLPQTSSIHAPSPTPTAYQFDSVLPPSTTQSQLYSSAISPLVSAFLSGYNSTVFAYGQTGSGKTYTMGTGGSSPSPEKEGVVPRVLQDVFAAVRNPCDGFTYSLSLTFMEIYNEMCRDLLCPSTPPKSIGIRETDSNEILVTNVTSAPTPDPATALRLLDEGTRNRSTGSTDMNSASSRSHAIFTLLLEKSRSSTDERTGVTHTEKIRSKFHLVDLAGSERAKRTGAVGGRLKESATINAGLLTLGKVIRSLSKPADPRALHAAHRHVPYRESKLTRLLQDSLGGNSRTAMIACVSPSTADYTESLSTLSYAARARDIRNKPVVVAKIVESIDHSSGLFGSPRSPRPGPDSEKLKAEVARRKAREDEMCTSLVDLQYATAEAKHLLVGFTARYGSALPPGAARQLGVVADLLVDETSKARPSPSPGAIREKDEEIARLKERVVECERDLARDEEIFAVKSRDIRTLQKHLAKQSEKAKALDQQLAEERKKGEHLQLRLRTPPTPPQPTLPSAATLLQTATAAFHKQQRHFDKKIQELAINIQVKRDLVDTINRSRQDAANLMARHERRKQELGSKIGRLRKEIDQREQDRLELSIATTVSNDSFDLGGSDISDHERSLEMAEHELESLSHQIRDQQRIVALQKQSVQRVTELGREIEEMGEKRDVLREEAARLEEEYGEERRRILEGAGDAEEPQPQGGEISPLREINLGEEANKENQSVKIELEHEKKRSEELLGINMKLLQDLKLLSKKQKEAELREGGKRRVLLAKSRLVEVPPPPPPL